MAIVWRARLLCGQFCSDNGPAASCAGCGAGITAGLARGHAARAAGGGGAVKAIPTAYAGVRFRIPARGAMGGVLRSRRHRVGVRADRLRRLDARLPSAHAGRSSLCRGEAGGAATARPWARERYLAAARGRRGPEGIHAVRRSSLLRQSAPARAVRAGPPPWGRAPDPRPRPRYRRAAPEVCRRPL